MCVLFLLSFFVINIGVQRFRATVSVHSSRTIPLPHTHSYVFPQAFLISFFSPYILSHVTSVHHSFRCAVFVRVFFYACAYGAYVRGMVDCARAKFGICVSGYDDSGYRPGDQNLPSR